MKKHIFVLTLAVYGASSAYAQITLNSVPERAVGTPQLKVTSFSPNLVEGRELYAPQALALDPSTSPPILYVSDYVNNRVLAWKNLATFTTGQSADLVIGQPDKVTTFPEGPAEAAAVSGKIQLAMPTTGLSHPSGLAVDKNGNLYVADAGNNRVLRFLRPFAQTGQYPVPDSSLVIGQGSLSSSTPNYPTGSATPTAQGIFLGSGSTFLVSSLSFDAAGDLWVLDTGNIRVLEFTAASLAGSGAPAAALEIGQPSLTQNATALNPNTGASYSVLNQFITPESIAFDTLGNNLYVADLNRVMVFPGPNFSSGMSASPHIFGVFASGYTFPTGSALQTLLDQTSVFVPAGIFFLPGGTGVGVSDAGYNRILIFPPFSSWPTDGSPPKAAAVIGQPNATCTATSAGACKSANNGNPQPTGATLYSPAAAVINGSDLYVVDSGNNRVLDLPQTGSTYGPAIRILGQDFGYANSPNLIEGREFQFSGSANGTNLSDAGIAIDNSTGTPHLYVADTYNNRILGFRDLRTFQNGAKNKADIVLGQPDFTTALVNYPTGVASTPNSSGLNRPVGLVVDSSGNLYVADSLNGRVLRFPAPFSYTGAGPEPADLVLGQQNFTSIITDPSTSTMAAPYGLAFTPACNTLTPPCAAPNGLLISDQLDNRVLYIPTTNGTFTAGSDNGKAATVVYGQNGFNSTTTGGTLTALNSPHHISCDTSGLVYVADTANNRVLIFPDPHSGFTSATGAAASTGIGNLSSPESVFVSPVTGEIWVANTGAADALRFANYNSVLLGFGSINGIIDVGNPDPTQPSFNYHPLAMIQDQYGDLFVADDAHRIAMYYPAVNLCNGASFLPSSPTSTAYPSATCLPLYDSALKTAGIALPSRYMAPGVIATIFPCENCAQDQFGDVTGQFVGPYPVPTMLSGVQVLVDGVAAPLYYVGAPVPPYSGQINFIVPNGARTSGFADVEVIRASTGQILGAAQMPMAGVAPGVFPHPGTQTGSVVFGAAINQDGTINSSSNPALRGQYISLYMTGEGSVPQVQDGVSSNTSYPSQAPVTVLLNLVDVNDPAYGESNVQHILGSGTNQYPGMWQVNVLIPKTVVPGNGACPALANGSGNEVCFVVFAGGTPNWDATSPYRTYLYIK